MIDADIFNNWKAEAEEENRQGSDRSDCLRGTFWVHPEISLDVFFQFGLYRLLINI